MALNLFQKRESDAAASTQFAATMIAMPTDLPVAAAPDSTLQDSSLQDSSLTDSAVGDSSSPENAMPDVVTDFGGLSLDSADPAAEPTLSHIGRYALKRRLGEGGLGAVFEAWDPLLSRAVAVKTLQFDVDARARVSLDGLFLNEARAAAGLSHKYIVTIHDAGLSAHGVYIAMERLYGRDLQQALAEGWRPTVDQTVQLVRRIAEALAYAHARGVVHCDIKPANIFLTSRARPKVLDFGIARVAHGAALNALDGAVAGSPRYRAPEQLCGGAIDARTDLFSLGVVMYEMLSGERAFEGDTLAGINQAVMNSPPRAASEVRRSVPKELSALVDRLMARDPAERLASAGDLVAELRRWSEQHPPGVPSVAVATASGAKPRAARPSRTRWFAGGALLLAAGLVALTGLVSGDGSARSGAETAPPRIPLAVTPAPAAAAAAVAPAAPAAAEIVDGRNGEAAAIAAAAPEATVVAAAPAGPNRNKPTRDAAPRSRAAAPDPALRNDTRPVDNATAAVVAAVGTVQLAISPWGHVEVDGQPAGTTPPMSRLTLSEGTHTVTVRNEDFPPHTVQVQVHADKPFTIRHRFGS